MPVTKPIVSTISAEEYFSIDAVNQSLIKHILRSPAHGKSYASSDNKPTPAMQLGTAVHTTILNPDNFAHECVVKPDINRRTKDGKIAYEKFLAMAKGRAVITVEQAATCLNVANQLALSSRAGLLLSGTEREQSFLWRDDKTQLTCKARIDALSYDDKSVVDLKTTIDASPDSFARTIVKFGYHVQAAFYLRAASTLNTGHEAVRNGWTFSIIAVETSNPYAVACYKLDERAIIEGDKLIDKALALWLDATTLGQYKSYPDELTTLSLPTWALTEPEGDDE